jgi:GntR family transcriptional regulator
MPSIQHLNRLRERDPTVLIPLYLQIQAELRDRIVTAIYPVGTLLPTEAELCAEFGASRYTVREALRRLTEQGFVRRRQGAGTLVVSTEPTSGYVQSFRTLDELFQSAMETHYVIVAQDEVVLTPDIAEFVGGTTGDTWIRITGTRWTKPGGSPIAYIQSYVPLRFRDIVASFPQARATLYAILEERSGEIIDEVVQEIQAVTMPKAVADSFGMPAGSLALRLLRRYVTRNGTLIASFNWHRADQFTYRMQLHRRVGS